MKSDLQSRRQNGQGFQGDQRKQIISEEYYINFLHYFREDNQPPFIQNVHTIDEENQKMNTARLKFQFSLCLNRNLRQLFMQKPQL